MIKLSIIIPVYNLERYIGECLDSLVKQLTPAVEVLVVDDCSTDGSGAIVERYATHYANVRLLRQMQNAGVSAARNRGLSEAEGEYVLFVDGDDFVADTYIEDVLAYTALGYDLVSFGHYDYVHNGDERYTVTKSGMNCACEATTPGERDWEMLLISSFFAAPWNKVYKRAFIANNDAISFDISCVCYEDYLFNLAYCRHIHNFCVVDKPLYYYRQNRALEHSGKRKWGQRFAISRLVAEKTNAFIAAKPTMDLSFLRRYIYAAFMTELQFIYRYKKRSLMRLYRSWRRARLLSKRWMRFSQRDGI